MATAPVAEASTRRSCERGKLGQDQGFLIDGGYGKIKGFTFRISSMGDETEATMGQLYAVMDEAMKDL